MTHDIRLIVSDIDGTLLDGASRMTEYTRQAIHDAQHAGVTFACCSGRFPENAAMVMAAAGIACPIISLNGAAVDTAHKGERLYEKFMYPDTARRVFDALETLGEGYFIFVRGGVVSRYANMKHHSEVDARREVYQSPDVWYQFGLQACLEALDMPVYKYYVYLTKDSHPPEALRAALGGIEGASLTQSGAMNIEVTGDEADKGVGVGVLAQWLGVQKHQIMALGDHLNDLSMLRAAGLKVAMGNSTRELKDIADYVTEDNNHDGAGRAIRRFALGEDVPLLQ